MPGTRKVAFDRTPPAADQVGANGRAPAAQPGVLRRRGTGDGMRRQATIPPLLSWSSRRRRRKRPVPRDVGATSAIPPLLSTIVLQQPARCARCGRKFAAGARVAWARQTERAFCRRCSFANLRGCR